MEEKQTRKKKKREGREGRREGEREKVRKKEGKLEGADNRDVNSKGRWKKNKPRKRELRKKE